MFACGKNISNDSFPQNVDQKTCPKFPLATWLCLDTQWVWRFWSCLYTPPKTNRWNLKKAQTGKGKTWTQTTNCWVPAVSFRWCFTFPFFFSRENLGVHILPRCPRQEAGPVDSLLTQRASQDPKTLEHLNCLEVASLKLTAKAPENRPSQKETSIPTIHFQGRTVSFRECNGSVGYGLLLVGQSEVSIAQIWFAYKYNWKLRKTKHNLYLRWCYVTWKRSPQLESSKQFFLWVSDFDGEKNTSQKARHQKKLKS